MYNCSKGVGYLTNVSKSFVVNFTADTRCRLKQVKHKGAFIDTRQKLFALRFILLFTDHAKTYEIFVHSLTL